MKAFGYTTLSILLFLGILIPAKAQNNPYKINDSLYTIYQRAFQQRMSPQGMLIVDTLYAKAVQLRDKKAQCLALTIPVGYYSNFNDYDRLMQTVKRLQHESQKNGYLQYFYYAYTVEINWLLNHGNSLRALQKSEEMKMHAFADKDNFGIFSCFLIQGNIHRIRGNKEVALASYKEALEYMQAHLPDQDQAYVCGSIAICYREKEEPDYDLALEYAEKAMKVSKTYTSRLSAMQEKCFLLYNIKRFDEFRACYKEYLEQMDKHKLTHARNIVSLRVYKLILDKEYALAHKTADSIELVQSRCDLHRIIYLAEGDYQNAYNCITQINNYKDSIAHQIQSSDLAEMTAQLGNERMKLDAQALEFTNTELNLKNTQLKLNQAKSQAELEKINAENSKLLLNNKNLELARLNIEAERQKAIMKEQQTASKHHITILCLILSFLLLFTILLGLHLYRRRKSMIALREKNNELTIARDCAEQSDKMKMYFIQNMSHEIRTPLNAIVGFSQLLSSVEMDLEEEEKQEFSLRIQQNSDLLTSLVDDLLDLASLESGKYTMRLASHSCNSLCRSAMGTVMHRQPQGVKLNFTSDVNDDYQIVTDERRLEQVLINFLTNAQKHTEEGEIRLHCSLTEHPGKVTFSVTDTGPGIPAEKADSVFERFNKLNQFKQGSGLGLNICSIIAERLNGEVQLDKTYTGGARFLFILPLNH